MLATDANDRIAVEAAAPNKAVELSLAPDGTANGLLLTKQPAVGTATILETDCARCERIQRRGASLYGQSAGSLVGDLRERCVPTC
jgi:hypothetical protein